MADMYEKQVPCVCCKLTVIRQQSQGEEKLFPVHLSPIIENSVHRLR